MQWRRCVCTDGLGVQSAENDGFELLFELEVRAGPIERRQKLALATHALRSQCTTTPPTRITSYQHSTAQHSTTQ